MRHRPHLARPLTAALTAALLGGPAAAEVRSPQTAAEVRALNDAARTAISAGDYGAALTAYRQAIARLRDEPDALAERTTAMFLAAVCLEKLDRPAEALVAHREALDAGLAEPLAGKALGRIEALQAKVVVTAKPVGEPVDAAEGSPAEGSPAEGSPAEGSVAGAGAGDDPRPAADPVPVASAPAAREVQAQPTPARGSKATPAETQPTPARSPTAPDAPLPADPEAALAAINERAKAAVSDKRWDDALAAYREAIERLTAMPERQQELAMTWFLAAVCLDQLGRRDEADPAYAQARALGPSAAIRARIDERIGPPPSDASGIAVQLACTPADLAITAGELDGASCDALRGLPPGTWRIEAVGTDGRRGSRTVVIRPGAGDYRISLVVPPLLDAPPPPVDRRAAWVLTVGALATAATGGALMALDDPDDLGPEARPVGIGLLTVGGALAVGAIIGFATADSPRAQAIPPGWGPVGWTF